jgi:hypothetical protein
LDDTSGAVRGAVVWALGSLEAKDFAGKIATLIDDYGKCSFYNKEKAQWEETSVHNLVEQVLKKWGIDTGSLKKNF